MYAAATEKEKKEKKGKPKKRHDDMIYARKEEHITILCTNLFGLFAASCFGSKLLNA